MKRILTLLMMILSLFVMTGCMGDKQTSAPTQPSIFTDQTIITKAMNELRELPELKGKDLKLFQDVTIADHEGIGNVIDLDLLKPDTTDKVDHYTYIDGKWTGPEPVQLTGDGNMDDNIMPINSIDFSKITQIYKIADEKAKSIEQGKVAKDLIYEFDIDARMYRAHIHIEGACEKYTGIFDAQGNLIMMRKE
ncbi:MAG: hypothetical protein E7204_05140 [Veillonella sp.]|uniref:hypothetical protein n=1 Tax=Veillonella sp. TaxID=1926307 RepID=UPI0025DD74CB|nr:hypothetical protein [Veillonella sp.]MBE6080212.1 hypothetical protein [Veillonella sp.]